MTFNKLFLIRHGESVGNADHQEYIRTPDWKIPLNEKGREQARETATKLLENGGDFAILNSPWIRAKQTADEIETVLSSRCIARRAAVELREQEYGVWRNLEDFHHMDKERVKYGVFYYRIPNGGESGADVYDRSRNFLRDLNLNKGHIDNLVIVTHGFTKRILMMLLLDWDVDFFHRVRNPKNAEIHTILNKDGKLSLVEELSLRPEHEEYEVMT